MRASEILYSKIEEVQELFNQYPEVQNPRIFGSIANGTDTEKSDIDILVSVDKNYSFLTFCGLHTDLEDLLKIKVDLVREHTLYNYIRKGIEWDKVEPLFKKRKIIMHRRIIARFCEICLAVQQIEEYSNGITEESILNGEGIKNYDAILMRLISLGESAHVIKSRHSDFAESTKINWKSWGDLRNITAHNYDGVDVFTILKIIEIDIPKLHDELVFTLENNEELQTKIIEYYQERKEERKYTNSSIINEIIEYKKI